MSISKHLKLYIILAVCIFLLIFVVPFFVKYLGKNTGASTAAKAPIIVQFTKVQKAHWQQRLSSIATVHANDGVQLKATAAGQLLMISPNVGRYVRKGAVLFKIDAHVLHAQLQQNLATLKFARQEYQRFRTLLTQGAITKEALEGKYKDYQTALANVSMTKQQIALTIIRAPFSGYLGLNAAPLGSYVKTGDVLAYLQTKRHLYVQFALPAAVGRLVHRGDYVTTQSSPQIQGKVSAIDSAVNPQTRMLNLRATLAPSSLIAGDYVMVNVYVGPSKPVLLLPQTAVITSTSGDYVYLVKAGKAVKTIVQTGDRRGNVVQISSGLTGNETVVSGGQIKIMPGMAVTNKGAIKLTTSKG